VKGNSSTWPHSITPGRGGLGKKNFPARKIIRSGEKRGTPLGEGDGGWPPSGGGGVLTSGWTSF